MPQYLELLYKKEAKNLEKDLKIALLKLEIDKLKQNNFYFKEKKNQDILDRYQKLYISKLNIDIYKSILLILEAQEQDLLKNDGIHNEVITSENLKNQDIIVLHLHKLKKIHGKDLNILIDFIKKLNPEFNNLNLDKINFIREFFKNLNLPLFEYRFNINSDSVYSKENFIRSELDMFNYPVLDLFDNKIGDSSYYTTSNIKNFISFVQKGPQKPTSNFNKELNIKNDIYLVKLNSINKKDKTLMYSYFRYDENFIPFLIDYIHKLHEMDVKNLGSVFLLCNSIKENIGLSTFNPTICYENNKKYFNQNIFLNKLDALNFLKLGPLYLNNKEILDWIDYLYTGVVGVDFLLNTVCDKFSPPYFDNKIKGAILKNAFQNQKVYNKQFIFNFIFLVKDIESFKENLKKYKLNGGPQKDRAKSSFLKADLYSLDTSFRKSLYISLILNNFNVKPQDFTYKNIHINLGDVRF